MKVSKKKQKSGRTNDNHLYIRNVRFECRLSPIEYDALVKRWEKSSSNSMASFARSCIFGEEDKIELQLKQQKKDQLDRLHLLSAINRVGNNVNQIAKKLNGNYGPKAQVLEDELAQIKAELKRLTGVAKE